MKKNLTELVFILDRSGSMRGLEQDTIGGFNSVLAQQKQEEGEALVSTVLFDHKTYVLHDRVDIQQVQPLTENEYFPRGSTALLDAIGGAIHHIGNVHKYSRIDEVPEHTMFVIITDGMENTSRIYSLDHVKRMIELEQTKYGWEFIFLGANMDAVQVAGQYGIHRNRAVNYHSDSMGYESAYRSINHAASDMRNNRDLDDDSWRRDVDDDYRSRGGRY